MNNYNHNDMNCRPSSCGDDFNPYEFADGNSTTRKASTANAKANQ